MNRSSESGTTLPYSDGQSRPALPRTSDVDLLRYCKGVVDLDAEIAHGALDLGMAEQQLNGPQIAGSAIA
jgi:hypothetical protein